MRDFWNETERAVWAASFALAHGVLDTPAACEDNADRCLEAFRSLRVGPTAPYRTLDEERPDKA